jgi:hypothetical protein
MELSYESWCSLSDDDLAKRDIAEVNLFAAYNLPFAGKLDVPALQKKLDDWADLVDSAIRRAWKRRVRGECSHLTGDQFRMLVLVTTLQRDLGAKYNLAFSEGEYDGTDSRNLFLHGILQGRGGTCVTMPVLYAAIGRRLGYPIRLVNVKQHTFCRWDEPGQRFNIEATCRGFRSPSDEHYRMWPLPISERELEKGGYLRSLAPRQELAFFLSQRGHCWFEHLQAFWAAEAHYWAHKTAPDDLAHHNHWGWSLLLLRMLDEIDCHAAIDPFSSVLQTLVPRDDWERRMYPFVHQHLLRILRNKRAGKLKAFPDLAIADLMTVYTT